MTPDEHLDSGAVAAYVDRAVAPAERDRIESHLADCPECRDEVVQVTRLRRGMHSARKWLIAVPAAAAAIVTLVLLRPADTSPSGTLRDGGERGLHVALLAPAESLEARPVGALTFVWRSVGGGVSYRFALTDQSGDIVWNTTSADTAVLLDTADRLRPGRYFWYVDALLRDGRSVTSGARSLRITH